jgi:hypothetical protein
MIRDIEELQQKYDSWHGKSRVERCLEWRP